MSGGEVAPDARSHGWKRRIAVYTLACGVIALLTWAIWEHRTRDKEMVRGKLLSQLARAMLFYMNNRDDVSDPPGAILSDMFGKDVLDRHAILTSKADPAASDIILIERPEYVDGEWCFAVFSDGHVKKVGLESAHDLIRRSGSTITAPTPSP